MAILIAITVLAITVLAATVIPAVAAAIKASRQAEAGSIYAQR